MESRPFGCVDVARSTARRRRVLVRMHDSTGSLRVPPRTAVPARAPALADARGHSGPMHCEAMPRNAKSLSTCLALIEIVNSCNLACPTCYADSPQTKQIDAVPSGRLAAAHSRGD
jgi:hypothetical protein